MSPTMIRPERRVLLGEIGAAHGIRGELLVKSYAENPADIAAYGPLTDESGRRAFNLTVVRVTPKGVIVRISGIEDRTAAEKLRLTKLYVARSLFPATEAGAYYREDLIGLQAISPQHEVIGKVTGVLNFGAGDLLEIRRPGKTTTEIIPFTDACVPEIDLENGHAVVIVPEYVEGESETSSETEQ